jgi:hypothetical protein
MTGSVSAQSDLDWPIWPDSSYHVLHANYGLYLGGVPPWMHSGLDIRAPIGTPVYTVDAGWVKTVTTKFDHYSYYRVVIGDIEGTDTCDAWLYAHIKESTIPVVAGQYVEAGTYLGDLVDWPDHPGTEAHLHFSRIRFAGSASEWAAYQDDWVFIANPQDFLIIDDDPDAPVFENAYGDQLLAFCGNESASYFDTGEVVSGDVDIICSAYDYQNSYDLKASLYSIEYKIEGDSSIPWTMATSFSDAFGRYDDMGLYINVVFQKDGTCNTIFDYSGGVQESFFNITNSDGDTLVEPSDKALCWQTPYFHNGDYWVTIMARDKHGNIAEDSMIVTVGNFYELSGSINLIDGNPNLSGTVVSIEPDGQSDTTDASGAFYFPQVGGSSQTISVSRSIYETSDTLFVMTGDTLLDITLLLGEYSCGDANGDGTVNVGDAVFEINYVFNGGPPPDPPRLGDANCDGAANVGDAVYLIAHIFSGGAPPCTECLQ